MISLQSKLATDFHRALADPRWMAACETFVTERLRRSGAFRTDVGTGILSSSYNEERFMGPQSVVKYRFEVDVRVSRSSEEESDTYHASLEYDPERATFSCLHEAITTKEEKARAEAVWRLVDEAQSLPTTRQAFQEFQGRPCPVCGSPIRVEIYLEGSAVNFTCSRDAEHLFSDWRVVHLHPEESWSEFVVDRTCPECSSPLSVVGILYGLIKDPTAVDTRAWTLGGCVVGPERWYCRACERRF